MQLPRGLAVLLRERWGHRGAVATRAVGSDLWCREAPKAVHGCLSARQCPATISQEHHLMLMLPGPACGVPYIDVLWCEQADLPLVPLSPSDRPRPKLAMLRQTVA